MAEQDREQRTEAPTPQRIERAFSEGQIGMSSELLASVGLAAGVVFFLVFGAWFFNNILTTLKIRTTYFDRAILNPNSIRNLLYEDGFRIGIAIAALMVPSSIVTILIGGLQTNFNLSFKPLELNWEKINPSKGFERIFSSRSAIRGLMAIIKAVAISIVAYLVVKSQFDRVVDSGTHSFAHMIVVFAETLLFIAMASAAIMTLLGVIDLAFQKWKHMQDLRMSVRDIKDEQKDLEGDPQVKARIKKLQNQLGRERMMNRVSTATAVITNPTHYAVAVEYEPDKMVAPKVVAKGKDHLAKKIIEIAKENGVPVVERKPVARFLYFNVSIDQSIPQELYSAVAEILNFIQRMGLDRRQRKRA